MRLVTLPSDPPACVVSRAKDLFYLYGRAAIGFEFFDHWRQPFRYLLTFLKPPLRVIVFETERCDAPPALERPELERLHRKRANPRDQNELRRPCDDLGIIAKTRRTHGLRRK